MDAAAKVSLVCATSAVIWSTSASTEPNFSWPLSLATSSTVPTSSYRSPWKSTRWASTRETGLEVVEGRLTPNRDRSLVPGTVRPQVPPGVDAVRADLHRLVDLQVGSREAELPAALFAVADYPPQLVPAAEQLERPP